MHEVRKLVTSGGERDDIVVRKTNQRGQGRSGGLTAIAIPRQEARRTNQRREGRHSNIVDQAILTFRRKKIEVEVVNVSGHGVMIRSEIEPRVGERMDIQFEDCNRTICYVRWVKGGQVGLEFTEETILITPAAAEALVPSGRRKGEQPPKVAMKADRPPRHSLMLRGTLHVGIESFDVRLRNISAEGAMLNCDEDLLLGAPVVLELAGGGAVAIGGAVRWCRSGQIGIVFGQAFDLTLLGDDNSSRPSADMPRYVKPDYLASDGCDDSPWSARTYGLRPQDL